MKSGHVIACYSQPAFIPLTNVDYKEGFIFSFGNNKIFTLKKQPNKINKANPKPITYDEYYITWGNSDIRIRSGKSYELYSSYLTPTCCYEEKGNKAPKMNDLFMQEERDALLADYEFFRVEFD